MELQIITKFAYNLLQASCKSVKIISHAGSTDLLQPRAKDLLAPGIQIDIISFNRLRLLFELRFSAFYISMDLIAILPRKPFILKSLHGQTASQLRQPMQALGCLSAGSAESAIGARKPPPVKRCSL